MKYGKNPKPYCDTHFTLFCGPWSSGGFDGRFLRPRVRVSGNPGTRRIHFVQCPAQNNFPLILLAFRYDVATSLSLFLPIIFRFAALRRDILGLLLTCYYVKPRFPTQKTEFLLAPRFFLVVFI